MTVTTKAANEYGCSTCYSRNVPSRSFRRLKRSRDDVREYEHRFGKTLDEDVKIGVILALAPPQVQIHYHLNSHILKSYAQVRTMLIDSCRAQADTAAGDVAHHGSLECWVKEEGQERQRRQERRRQQKRKWQS